jgi:carbon-monoxide dehydrogenase medium subunit
MEYVAPETVDAACRALESDGAQCLAGGQSLVAMMNLGLATPARLVSLRRIGELRGIERKADGGVRIAAMTTHAELASLSDADDTTRLLAQTARVVAYPAVRNRGTIGGSTSLADPAADYPVALVALGATIEMASSSGRRTVTAVEFFRGMFETALVPGEIVTAIHLPALAAGTSTAYEKLSIVAGDFAILSVAVVAASRDDRVRVAVGGYAMRPILLSNLRRGSDVDAIARELAAHGDPPHDQRASSAYRRRVAPALVARTIRSAQ